MLDDYGIRTGKYAGKVTYLGVPQSRLDEDVARGQAALLDAIEKGMASVHPDGRIVMNTELHPFMGDPLQNVRMMMESPRMLLSDQGQSGTTLLPVHPLDAMQKATVTTGDAGAYNAIFGAIATLQVQLQQNAYAALPKRPYQKEGFRAVSAAGVASAVGIGEGGNVPAAVEPTYQEITVGLKEHAAATEMSTRLELVSTKNDTITFGGNAQVCFTGFMNQVDTSLLQDTDTLAGNNIESIDRVTSSTAEVTALGYTAGDEDLYGIDRTGASWFDGNADHFSGVDKPLQLQYLDALFRDQYPYWGNDISNKLWLTSASTWMPWSNLEGTKQRFSQETVTYTYSQGVQPTMGQAGGFKVSTYNMWPIVLDANVQQDTIGRVYLLDLNHTGIVVGRPFEVIEGNNPVYLTSFVNRVVFYGIQELWCDLPKASGHVRDLA